MKKHLLRLTFVLSAVALLASSGEANAQSIVFNGFLQVSGSNRGDLIEVQPTDDATGVTVRINGWLQSLNGNATFSPNFIVVFGQAGNDEIILRKNTSGDTVFDVPGMSGVALYGEAGNDIIDPGNDVGNAVLFGGDHADTIVRYYIRLWRGAYPLTPNLNDFTASEGDNIDPVYYGRQF